MSIEPETIEKAPDFGTQNAHIYVDHTHLGRHVTGLERITQELFAPDSLAPLKLTPVRSRGTAGLVLKQNIALPSKLVLHRKALMLCPGFPPSLALSAFGARVIPYIHDLFLLERDEDLNPRARLYMAPAFRKAVKTLPRFMVNSQYTAHELRKHCHKEAQIWLYRPMVRNIFGLSDAAREAMDESPAPLRLIALGTIEPRKNLRAAVHILNALRAGSHPDATLDIVGRHGWGEDLALLQNTPGITLHGYLSIEQTRALLERADLFLNTSFDEGLGLPLLEAQYAGLPVIAPQGDVFAEVLGKSGLQVNTGRPDQAAEKISALMSQPDWRVQHKQLAAANLTRWNEAALADRLKVTEKLSDMVQKGASKGVPSCQQSLAG